MSEIVEANLLFEEDLLAGGLETMMPHARLITDLGSTELGL